MEYSYAARPSKYALLAEELFDIHRDGRGDEELAVEGIARMKEFLKSVDRLLTLKDVGIAENSKFEQMADDALKIYGVDGEYLDNPKRLYKNDIVGLFTRLA